MKAALHERVTTFANRPSLAKAERIAGDLAELVSILDDVTAELEEFSDALDTYGESEDRDERAEARETFASSDLAHDLAKLGRFLDGLPDDGPTS